MSCEATPFSASQPPDAHVASFSRRWYHDDGLWAALAPPYEERWFAGEPPLKVLWYTEHPGELELAGRRIDGPGTLTADVPPGYDAVDYQPSLILFPEPGCWEITGSVGERTLRIVAEVLSAAQHPFSGP